MRFNKLNQYLKGNLAEKDMEQVTKELVNTYFQEKALKTKWKKILAADEELLALKEQSEQQALSDVTPEPEQAPIKVSDSNMHKTLANESMNKDQSAISQLKEQPSLSTPTANKFRLFTLLSSAAAGIILIFAAWGLFQHINTPSYIRLADTFLAQSYEVNQSRKGPEEELRMAAKTYYEEQHYDKALSTLIRLEKTTSLNVKDLFMLGLIHLRLEAWQSAITAFDKVIADSSGSYREEAAWFKGLALVKSNNRDKAIQQLEKIVYSKGWKHEQAKQLLQALKES